MSAMHVTPRVRELRSSGLLRRESVPSSGVGCPETSARNYHYSLRNNPEERSFHLFRGGSLKSRILGMYTHIYRRI